MSAKLTLSATDSHGRKVEVTATGHENQHVAGLSDAVVAAFNTAAKAVCLGSHAVVKKTETAT